MTIAEISGSTASLQHPSEGELGEFLPPFGFLSLLPNWPSSTGSQRTREPLDTI